MSAAAVAPLDGEWVAALDARLSQLKQHRSEYGPVLAELRARFVERPHAIDLTSITLKEHPPVEELGVVIAQMGHGVDFGESVKRKQQQQQQQQPQHTSVFGQLSPFKLVIGPGFFPFRLLDDGSGVEMRFKWYVEYRSVSDSDMAAAKQRLAQQQIQRMNDFFHCEKLLRELPEAMANSRKAEQELVAAIANGESDDMAGVGAIKLEQHRIDREVKQQEERLKQLRSAPEPTLWWELITLWRSSSLSLTVPFAWGVQEWEGQFYHFARAKPQPKVQPNFSEGN